MGGVKRSVLLHQHRIAKKGKANRHLLVAAETYHSPLPTDSKVAIELEHAVCANDSGVWRVKHAATSPAVENFMVSKNVFSCTLCRR